MANTATTGISAAPELSISEGYTRDIFVLIGLAADMALSSNPLNACDILDSAKEHVDYELFEHFQHIRDAITIAAFHTHISVSREPKTARSNATVYFLQNTSGKIKIGYSKNVANRIKQLSIGSHDDLVLLATTIGGSKKEASLHKKFKKDRVSNEWFNPSVDLMAFIASINEKGE